MSEKPDISEWQDDGHLIAGRLAVYNESTGCQYGILKLDVMTCPPDSACHRWFENEASQEQFRCFVAEEIEHEGALEFIDRMIGFRELPTTERGPRPLVPALPSDWSSPFPVAILWRDLGEDGIAWRPKHTDPRSGASEATQIDPPTDNQRRMAEAVLSPLTDTQRGAVVAVVAAQVAAELYYDADAGS